MEKRGTHRTAHIYLEEPKTCNHDYGSVVCLARWSGVRVRQAIATAIAHFDGSDREQQFVRCARFVYNCNSEQYQPNVDDEDTFLCVVHNRLTLQLTGPPGVYLKRKRAPSQPADDAHFEDVTNKRPRA